MYYTYLDSIEYITELQKISIDVKSNPVLFIRYYMYGTYYELHGMIFKLK